MVMLRLIFALAVCKLSLIAAGDVGEPPVVDPPRYEMDSCACEMPTRNDTQRLCSSDINFLTHLKLVGYGNPRCHNPVDLAPNDDQCMSVVYTFESTKVGGVTIDISTPRDSPGCEIVPKPGVKYTISGNQFQKPLVKCNELNAGDVVFIVDESGSVGEENYNTVVIPFLEDLKNALVPNPGPSQVNFGTVSFDHIAKVRFPLESGRTSVEISTLINGLIGTYTGGATAIGDALAKAADEVLIPPFDTDANPNICIVITDGQNNTGISVEEGAAKLKPKCPTIFAIGVGPNIDQMTLEIIASDTGKAIRVSDFGALSQTLVETIRQSICTPTGETKKVCSVKHCLGIFRETDHDQFHNLKKIYDGCNTH